MKLSVSIVTYNHERFIGPCLDSILAQQVDFDYEIVVGEDFSTDGTREVLESYRAKYPDRIRLILRDRNVGVNRNFQEVLDACRGEYIAHMDGDDAMLPGKLKKQVAFLDSRPDCSMVTHDVRVFESDTGKTLYFFNSLTKIYDGSVDDLIRLGPYFCNSSKMYRKSALPPEGIDRKTNYVIDWLLHIQTARHGRIGYLDEVLGEYRIHTGGTTSLPLARRKSVFKDQLYTLERAAGYGVSDRLIELAYSRIHADLASHFLKEGEYAEFRRLVMEGYRHRAFGSSKHKVFYLLRDFPAAARLVYRLQHGVRMMRK